MSDSSINNSVSSIPDSVPDTQRVGQATWTFLHTMAAAYPDTPSEKDKKHARKFIQIFSKMYPCGICAEDFREIIHEMPPRVENKKDFSLWMCKAHNKVNEHLGKPQFDCRFALKFWSGEDVLLVDDGNSKTPAITQGSTPTLTPSIPEIPKEPQANAPACHTNFCRTAKPKVDGFKALLNQMNAAASAATASSSSSPAPSSSASSSPQAK